MSNKLFIITLLFSMGLFLFSCEKQEPDYLNTAQSPQTKEFMSPLEEFACILSRATAAEESLRVFIKTEALKQFDRDYDVFFPLTKNSLVKGEKSFAQILSEYDYKEAMPFIEQSVPTLTVLVPDWAWVNDNCFSIKAWDTSDRDIAIGYQTDSLTLSLFVNGLFAGSLEYGEIPGFPVLIVKKNERIVSCPNKTRAGGMTYQFVNKVFDGTRYPTTRSQVYTQEWDYIKDGSSDFVPESALSNLLVTAYDEFSYGSNAAMQRDYIYYGMTNTNTTNGVLNPNIRERLYRFKVSAGAASNLIDVDDPQFQSELIKWRNKNAYEGNEIQPFLWSDGALEIHIAMYKGDKHPNSMVSAPEMVFHAKPEDLWQLKKSQVIKEWKFFSWMQNKYTYISSVNDLVYRWYYPEDVVDLPLWDISKESTELWFHAYEYDDSQTVTKQESKTFKYTNNFKQNDGATFGDKIKLSRGIEYGESDESSMTSGTTIVTSHVSNQLGDINYAFSDPIIISQKMYNEGVGGYNVRSVSNGTLTITLIPHDIRYNY